MCGDGRQHPTAVHVKHFEEVDDAVVVAEAIHNRNEKGIYGTEAALQGAFEVYKPILFAVVTTIIAFIPLIGLPGPEGKMMQAIPIVVIATLIFSVIESFLILPAQIMALYKLRLWLLIMMVLQ